MALKVALSCVVFLLSLISFVAMITCQEQRRNAVQVGTGDVPYGGMDSIISLMLKSSSAYGFTINNLEDWGVMGADHNYFEQGNRDLFVGNGTCLSVCAITVTSNGAWKNPGWLLDYVKINIIVRVYKIIRFPVDQWLEDKWPFSALNATRDFCTASN